MNRFVLGFYITRSGAILICKTRPEWQRGKWNGIGGRIEEGETPLQAMVREFEEEAGFKTSEEDWVPRFVISSKVFADNQWEMFVFSTFGELPHPYFPRDTDEGLVCHMLDIPSSIDSTAAWLLTMFRDIYIHQLTIGQYTLTTDVPQGSGA